MRVPTLKMSAKTGSWRTRNARDERGSVLRYVTEGRTSSDEVIREDGERE